MTTESNTPAEQGRVAVTESKLADRAMAGVMPRPIIPLKVEILSLIEERTLKLMQAYANFTRGVWFNKDGDLSLGFYPETDVASLGDHATEAVKAAVEKLDPDKGAILVLASEIEYEHKGADGQKKRILCKAFLISKPNSAITVKPIEEVTS